MNISPTSTLLNAACRNLPEADAIFFPPPGNGHARARKVCGGCLDRDECLAIALSYEVPGEDRYGIWGGLSARERARLYG